MWNGICEAKRRSETTVKAFGHQFGASNFYRGFEGGMALPQWRERPSNCVRADAMSSGLKANMFTRFER